MRTLGSALYTVNNRPKDVWLHQPTLHGYRVLEVPKTETAPLLGDSDSQQSHLAHLGEHVLDLLSKEIFTWEAEAAQTSGILLVLSISAARGAISLSAKLATTWRNCYIQHSSLCMLC